MIIIHDTFVCKPGQASKLAALYKDAMVANPNLTAIMTDMTGQYNRVIMVTTYESLTAYEKSWENMKNPTDEMKQAMAKLSGYQDMYTSGSREIFKVW